MKRLNLIMVIFMSAVMFTACEKEENSHNNSNKHKTKADSNFEKSDVPSDTTYIEYSDFESEFEVFAENFFTLHPIGLIRIHFLDSRNLYGLTTKDVGPIDPSTSLRIVCRGGDKGTVMNCASLFADGNPLGCWAEVHKKSWDDGSGRYYYIAYEMCP